MSTATMTDSDISTRTAVMRQLEWDPEVDAGAIGVAAKNGAVTLTGYIDSYSGKLAAERAAKRVRGVRAVANDIEVRLKLARTDADIAADIVRALELRSTTPATIQANCTHGTRHAHGPGRAAVPVARCRKSRASHSRRTQRDQPHQDRTASCRTGRSSPDRRGAASQCEYRRPSHYCRRLGRESDSDRQRRELAATELAERGAADAPGVVQAENHIMVEPRLVEEAVPDEISLRHAEASIKGDAVRASGLDAIQRRSLLALELRGDSAGRF